MPYLNEVRLVGHLTADPKQFSHATSGKGGYTICVAVNTPKKNAQTGEWEDNPQFIYLDCWGKMGDAVKARCHKGSAVLVQGRLKVYQWTDPSGKRGSKLLVEPTNIQSFNKPQPAPAAATKPTQEWSPSDNAAYEADEDIPF